MQSRVSNEESDSDTSNGIGTTILSPVETVDWWPIPFE